MTEPVLASNRVRPSQVIILGARMTSAVLDLVKEVEEAFAVGARDEAIAQERQRIIELVGDMCTYRERDGSALSNPHPADHLGPCPFGKVVERILASGSVSAVTPLEPVTRCGEKRSQSDAGASWLNAEQYDSVALCCDEPAGHPGDHRCNEGKPGHDTWLNYEARTAAEPSVGTLSRPAERHVCSGTPCPTQHHAFYGQLCNVPNCVEDFCIGSQELAEMHAEVAR